MNKASGDDGIPVEPFQILKDDAVKVLHSNVSKFGKLSSGLRTGNGQFSPQDWKSSELIPGLEKINVHPNPKERQCQRILKLF